MIISEDKNKPIIIHAVIKIVYSILFKRRYHGKSQSYVFSTHTCERYLLPSCLFYTIKSLPIAPLCHVQKGGDAAIQAIAQRGVYIFMSIVKHINIAKNLQHYYLNVKQLAKTE